MVFSQQLPYSTVEEVVIICLKSIILLLSFRGSTMLYMPREEGQGLVEYALILVLVAVVVIVILALLGPAIGNIFSNVIRNL
jgi:pilus assembly protein Flp/PilA